MEHLLEVQQQVRSLENDIRALDIKVQAVSESLNYIQSSEKKSGIDDERISLLAKNLPFGDYPLKDIKDNHIVKLYVTVLLNIAMQGTEQTKIPDQLIFVQWILQQMKIKKKLSDLLVDVYKINDATYEELRKLSGEVNWRIKSGEEVEKNETIGSVSKGRPGFRPEKIELKTPKAGKIFYFRNNNIHYAVWVPVWSQDSKEKVKEWALKNDD